MAKVSTNSITDYSQDWGNDVSTGLPYSGEAVQKFIKDELQDKLSLTDAETVISDQLTTRLFLNGNGKIVTGIEGNSEALTITQLNSAGNTVTSDINIGKADANDRFVTVAALLSSAAINLGGLVSLSYGFTVADYQNELIPNSFASVNLSIARQGSSVAFYTASLGTVLSTQAVGNTSQSVDLTSIISLNITGSSNIVISLEVSHTYSYVDEEGVNQTKVITKYGSVNLTVLSLTLNTSINLINASNSSLVNIPYSVKGNGSKTVYLYKNGKEVDKVEGITSSSSSGVFQQSLTSGTTNFLLVAETTSGDTVVRSSSYYFDLFTSTSNTVIALLVEDTTGSILDEYSYNIPTFSAYKFSTFKFNYYAYNANDSSVSAVITTDELNSDGNAVVSSPSSLTLNRKIYTYSKTIKSSNKLKVTFNAGDTIRAIYITPLASDINIELPTESLELNLDADGRSNEEVNPAVWSYGDTTTEFEGLNWQSNGWVDNALLLQNGAKAIINFPLFLSVNNYPVTRDGCTFEILFKCSNATLEENDIISCYWLNNDNRDTGLKITTSYVGVNTGEVTDYKDDDGSVTQSIVTRVGSQYAQDTYYKYTFVIDPNAPSVGSTNGLCYGYLDGILSFIAPVPSSFINLNKIPITIDSTYADVYIKSIKYYDEPLTIDQCVDEHIIDLESSTAIEELYNKNNVLSQDSTDNDYVSPQKIRAMGKGVMIISPSDAQTSRVTLQDLNKSSDKKSYYGPFRVDYFAPENDVNLGYATTATKGNAFNFTHTEAAIRIQGTTSTKRPRKNYRINFNKKTKSEKPAAGSFIVGGEVKDNFKYAMSLNAVEVPICCLKVDYVDSSMTHNTAGAMVFNELTKNVESLRNPAQTREYKTSVNDIKTRVAIEGFPIDVFAADSVVNPDYTDTLEDSNYVNLQYMGQYNFNNDKSSSGEVFGFDGAYKYDADGTYNKDGSYQPICVEFLDNNADLDLFHIKFTTRDAIDEASTYPSDAFSNQLEVRAPADVTDQAADYGIDSLATTSGFEQYAYVPTQLKRVFNFIGTCAKEVATANGKKAYDLNSMKSEDFEALDWTCEYFINNVLDYFNLSSVCAWYLWTDYLLAVDQRAKNMMMYTMDGTHWMFLYYDGDTVLGERNDCYLAYDYLTDRTTYDYGVGQYALQGHDSWLWYLIRANFSTQRVIDSVVDTKTAINLSSVCKLMRSSGKFSADYFKEIFNGQYVNNWSQRQYNYSQKYKYITPLTETGYPSDISTNFISTAQGSREAHRTYTLENRFNLLDSKYQAGNYEQDAFIYVGDAALTNKVTIVSSIPYYFAWKTSNTGIRDHLRADSTNNYTVSMEITGNAANNPANVLGASRIKELYIDSEGSWKATTGDTINVNGLTNLLKLVASNLGSNGSGNIYITDCPLINYVDLSNSTFTGLSGLNKASKLKYLNVSGTSISSVRLAAGAPIENLILGTPKGLYLSNLNLLQYNNSDSDTLTAQDWSQLSELLVNDCPNINWESLFEKLKSSNAATKYLRITGIDREDSITWLDQFTDYYGLDEDGNLVTTGAQLVGTLQLPTYTDDDIVKEYSSKFTSLTIKQPEYTIIESDESITDESGFSDVTGTVVKGNITNFDNNTGARNSTRYVPSGHIANILSKVHRVLGKVVTKGKSVLIETNPKATDKAYLNARDKSGTMYVIQLEDTDSRYFSTGYGSSLTRREANLSGLQSSGYGEVYVKFPGFWYKGINYLSPTSVSLSRKYTCFSSQETRPSTSSETRVLTIADLKASPIDLDADAEGLYKESRVISFTNAANYIDDRIPSTSNSSYDIVRVNVEGYKKVRYPLSVGQTCCVFTGANGLIISNTEGTVQNVGEFYVSSSVYAYNGMPAIVTVPSGAKWFYIGVPKYVSGSITADPCDIVLHKGSKFNSGEEMTAENAKDWIADMEPDWVYSEPVCIAASELSSDDSLTVYTSFNGTKTAAVGTLGKDVADINVKGDWFLHSLSEAAYSRGLQLVDYEADKLIAMLFTAKYGRRNSQNVLGAGSSTTGRKLGASRQYGMTDTTIPTSIATAETWANASIPVTSSSGVISYTNIEVPVFLGLENIQGNAGEWMDRVFMANETSANCGKLRITQPDLSTRRVYFVGPSGNYPQAVVHGKYCDICSCSTSGGGTVKGYCDYQSSDTTLRSTWASTRALRRSSNFAGASGGVFCLNADNSVGYSSTNYGSRLIFRGNIVETSDIDFYLNLTEIREN